MKRFGAKLHAKSLAAVSFILLIATLVSCLLAFPASAAVYGHTSAKSIENRNTGVWIGTGSDIFDVDTESLTMWWNSRTASLQEYTSSITRGEAQVAVWYHDGTGYIWFDETTGTTGTIQDKKMCYTTSGAASYASSNVFPYIENYGIMGMVNYNHSLTSSSQGYSTGNYYITFGMSSKTSTPSFVNHY